MAKLVPAMKWKAYLQAGLLLFCLMEQALSSSLNYQLNELPEDIARNIHAHLGSLPEAENERAFFVYAADQQIKNALLALGYYRAEVSITVDRQSVEWHMDIAVDLNEPTILEQVDVDVRGEAANDQAFIDLLAGLVIEPGQILHHGQYEDLKSSLTALGLQRGYFDGELVDTHIAVKQNLQTASIQVYYESGERYRFGELDFDQSAVNDSLLRLLAPFEYGDLYALEDLQRLQSHLQQTGYFSNILVLPDRKNTLESYIPVNVSLAKAKRHYFDLGVGFSTDTKVRASVGWRMPVVNQRGHSLESKIEYSKISPAGRLTYKIPLSHPLNDILQMQVELKDDEYGDIGSRYLSSRITRVKSEGSWVRNYYLRHLIEEWDYQGLYDDASYLLPGLTLSRTRRSGPTLDPNSGFRQLYGAEVGGSSLGSEISLLRFTARWLWVGSLGQRHRFVGRAELGANLIDSKDELDLAPSLRFYAGGDQSVRGFKYQSLGPTIPIDDGSGGIKNIVVGGKNLAVASLEYQYYFKEKWRVAFFSDGGNAFDGSDFKPEYSVGTGLHWISPIGAIRFDLAYSLSQESPALRIHINMGAEL